MDIDHIRIDRSLVEIRENISYMNMLQEQNNCPMDIAYMDLNPMRTFPLDMVHIE